MTLVVLPCAAAVAYAVDSDVAASISCAAAAMLPLWHLECP